MFSETLIAETKPHWDHRKVQLAVCCHDISSIRSLVSERHQNVYHRCSQYGIQHALERANG